MGYFESNLTLPRWTIKLIPESQGKASNKLTRIKHREARNLDGEDTGEKGGLQFGVIFSFQDEGKTHLLLSLLPNSKVSCFFFSLPASLVQQVFTLTFDF